MTRVFALALVLAIAPSISAQSTKTHKTHTKAKPHAQTLNEDTRRAFIGHANVWMPTDIPSMDLRAGPQGAGAFAPNVVVTCNYVEKAQLPGTSRKFDCAITPDDVVKVRYGADNGKVEGEVLSSRLLWALGFGADRVYPVTVRCRGCSPDPWNKRARVDGEQVFDPAAIERTPPGHEMKEAGTKAGWFWTELNSVDEADGGAPRAQRDALKLLAVLIQHTDTKAVQQRLLCLPGGLRDNGTCDQPFMMLHDVGLTFGHANFFNRTVTGSVNFDQWAPTPIWRDQKACVGHLSQSVTGTLGDPKISEAGRQFLADLLVQLTDAQLHDLFAVARVDRRSRKPNTSAPPASVDDWVAAFKHKRDEIASVHCPS